MDSPRALRSSPRFMSMTKDARRQRSPPPEEPEERISWDGRQDCAALVVSLTRSSDIVATKTMVRALMSLA